MSEGMNILAKAIEALQFPMGKETPCEICDGDGIERCDNPDHGFIEAMPGEVGRLGCPCCGHDSKHRMFGNKCPDCDGTGRRP